MYNEKVMEHFQNPRNVGILEDAHGVGEVGSAACGDIMKIYIKVANNCIGEIKFQTYGCGAAVATTSMLTEMVLGMPLEEAELVDNRQVADALGGLPEIKLHCSNLAADALRLAISDFRSQHHG
ncbi:MAG: iron-sulfur cluster assembly scaffold protein [Symbiobacteriaceae bacterium]|nr:iron-sulfur cluster assembly scaffold protein [Symbiobacteriaceae bacterium]